MASYRYLPRKQQASLKLMRDTNNSMPKKKSWVGDVAKLILFLGVGFFFIYWFLLKLDPSQKAAIWDSFLHANYFWAACVMLSCLSAHFIRALRWQLLYEPLGAKPGLNNTFGAVIVTYMANLAFPRLGEVLRCALLRTSDDIPVERSLGTVVTERCFDVLAFGVVVLIGMLFMYGQAREWLMAAVEQKAQGLPSMVWLALAVVALCVVAVWLYRKTRRQLVRFKLFAKIDGMIVGALDGLRSIFHLRPRSVVLFVLYSILIYFFYLLGGVIILQAFPETHGLGFGAAFVLYLFGSVGMTISQGGLGAYPVLVMESLALYGVADTIGLAAGWLLWAAQQVIVIVVGLAYLVYFSLVKKKSKSSEIHS